LVSRCGADQYDFEANDYRSRSLSRQKEDIGAEGIVELAAQRQLETWV
jgi:hypothetical protein